MMKGHLEVGFFCWLVVLTRARSQEPLERLRRQRFFLLPPRCQRRFKSPERPLAECIMLLRELNQKRESRQS